VRRLRAVRPDIRLSSDFIVGFPGETDEDFARTMKLIEDIGFDYSFSFVFSPRPGTPAANLDDDTPQAVKLARLQTLQAAIEDHAHGISRSMVDTVQRILVEGPSRRLNDGVAEWMGRTECNRIVNFPAPPDAGPLVGRLVDVRITEARPHSLRAVMATAAPVALPVESLGAGG
jgi:tRNA-2-methylthio-N6-dimethylallyladenosine synthase